MSLLKQFSCVQVYYTSKCMYRFQYAFSNNVISMYCIFTCCSLPVDINFYCDFPCYCLYTLRLSDSAVATTDYTMPASTDITFALGAATGTLDITIVQAPGVNGNKRFTVGFTAVTVGQPSNPNTMEIIILEAGKS